MAAARFDQPEAVLPAADVAALARLLQPAAGVRPFQPVAPARGGVRTAAGSARGRLLPGELAGASPDADVDPGTHLVAVCGGTVLPALADAAVWHALVETAAPLGARTGMRGNPRLRFPADRVVQPPPDGRS